MNYNNQVVTSCAQVFAAQEPPVPFPTQAGTASRMTRTASTLGEAFVQKKSHIAEYRNQAIAALSQKSANGKPAPDYETTTRYLAQAAVLGDSRALNVLKEIEEKNPQAAGNWGHAAVLSLLENPAQEASDSLLSHIVFHLKPGRGFPEETKNRWLGYLRLKADKNHQAAAYYLAKISAYPLTDGLAAKYDPQTAANILCKSKTRLGYLTLGILIYRGKVGVRDNPDWTTQNAYKIIQKCAAPEDRAIHRVLDHLNKTGAPHCVPEPDQFDQILNEALLDIKNP